MNNETDVTEKIELFRSRLKLLRGKKNLQTVAQDLGISRASLGYYENGERKPDIEILVKLAKYYNVSCDYLLGFTETKTPNVDTRAITEKTGLNEQSVNRLEAIQQESIRLPADALDTTPVTSSLFINTINELLNPSSEIIQNITYYLYANFEYFYDDTNYNCEEFYNHISELGLFDKKLGIDYLLSYQNLSQLFLFSVQKDLVQLREELQKKLPKRIIPVSVPNDFDEFDESVLDEYFEQDND